MNPRALVIAVSVTIVIGFGCTGEIAGSAETTATEGSPARGGNVVGTAGVPVAGAAPPPANAAASGARCAIPSSSLRRLTVREYSNTVRDLLAASTGVAQMLVPDSPVDGFDNNLAGQLVALPNVQQYLVAAESIAERAAEDLPKLVGCDWRQRGETECAKDWIGLLGKRAYRRPLTADEATILMRVYDAVRRAADFKTGVVRTLQAILTAPQFLYRLEPTELTARIDGAPRLSSWEVASRLSYLFWSSMPDAELLAAAEADRLQSRADVVAQARRLLADPRAKTALASFYEQWLGLEEIATLEKDRTRFPRFTTAARQMLDEEARRFVDHVLWQEGGKLGALLGASAGAFRSEALASYYADPASVMRRGILSLGGFLAAISAPDKTNLIHRGKFIQERFFCGVIPPPLPGVSDQIPQIAGPATARQRFAYLLTAQACAPCHGMMNPIGLALENYDAVGRWRTTDEGLPIDPSAALAGTDVDGPVAGPNELAQRVVDSEKARDCAVTAWFRFAFGRTELPADACTMAGLKRDFAASGSSARELLLALIQTDAFLHRSSPEGAAP